MEITKSVVIGETAKNLYRVCTDFDTLPKFLRSLRSIERTGETTSHWIAEGPGGKTYEWEAQMTRLEPDKRIAWNTLRDGDLKTSGQLTFTPLPHDQTEITLMVKIISGAELERETERLVEENLRALKTSVESTSKTVQKRRSRSA